MQESTFTPHSLPGDVFDEDYFIKDYDSVVWITSDKNGDEQGPTSKSDSCSAVREREHSHHSKNSTDARKDIGKQYHNDEYLPESGSLLDCLAGMVI